MIKSNTTKLINIIWLTFVLMILAGFLIFLSVKNTGATNNKIAEYAKDNNRYIAHAGGQIGGYNYTNSLEALNKNYQRGFKLFELDIIVTSDGHFVAAHDWEKWKNMTQYKGDLPPTKAEFISQKLYDEYMPMDMDKINSWFSSHPDAILVTDKINTPISFANQFIDKKRLIMELFTWEAVQQAIELNIKSAMPTGKLLKKIKGDKIQFLKSLNITDIALSRNFLKSEKNLILKLNKAGIRLYAFHVNRKKGKGTEYMICNESMYFYGIYANIWDRNIQPKCK